jgi:hypothetical protein
MSEKLKTTLTVFYGSFLGIFFYDYIIRNAYRLLFNKLEWTFLSGGSLGTIFFAITIWFIIVVSKDMGKKRVILSTLVLSLVFLTKFIHGCVVLGRKKGTLSTGNTGEDWIVFLSQTAVFFAGLVLNFIYACRID